MALIAQYLKCHCGNDVFTQHVQSSVRTVQVNADTRFLENERFSVERADPLHCSRCHSVIEWTYADTDEVLGAIIK